MHWKAVLAVNIKYVKFWGLSVIINDALKRDSDVDMKEFSYHEMENQNWLLE
jgi:hypothetical protein